MHTENNLPPLTELCSELLREIGLGWLLAVEMNDEKKKESEFFC